VNNRERILAILNGEKPDRVPFMPFSELMPDSGFVQGLRSRGMGFITHCSSVQSDIKDIEITEKVSNGKLTITYHTPAGDVSALYDKNIEKITGNSLGVQIEHVIKDVKDYEAAIYIIDHTIYNVNTDEYYNIDKELGNDGITHCWTDEPPYMGAQYCLGLENWSYHQFDYPEEFQMLLNALDRKQERMLTLLLDCPDNIINLGNLAGNFGPPQYEKYMLPYYEKYVPQFKKRGKITTIHADASNLNEHKELLLKTGIDVVEAFTPPPFGNLSLADARKAWGEKTTIWINFPESVFYNGYEATRKYTVELLKSDPCPNKFVSLTEMGLLGLNENNERMFQDGIKAIMDAIDETGIY